MVSVTGMTTALQLVRSYPLATTTEPSDPTARIEAIVSGVSVAMSPAMKQAATLASALTYAAPAAEAAAAPATPAEAVEAAPASAAQADPAQPVVEDPVYAPPLTIYSLASELRAVYHDFKTKVESGEAIQKYAREMLATTTDAVQRERYENILQSPMGQLTAEDKARIATINTRFEDFANYFKTNYVVVGEIYTVKPNGRIQLGVFDVYAPGSGDFYFGRGADRKMRQWDPVLGTMSTWHS